MTKKTTSTTTREERKLMEDAAKIIQRELVMGLEVRIPGLGLFNVSTTTVNMGVPGENTGKRKKIGVVRFRPFDALKKKIRHIRAGEPKVADEEEKVPAVATPVAAAPQPSPARTKEPHPLNTTNTKNTVPTDEAVLPKPTNRRINW